MKINVAWKPNPVSEACSRDAQTRIQRQGNILGHSHCPQCDLQILQKMFKVFFCVLGHRDTDLMLRIWLEASEFLFSNMHQAGNITSIRHQFHTLERTNFHCRKKNMETECLHVIGRWTSEFSDTYPKFFLQLFSAIICPAFLSNTSPQQIFSSLQHFSTPSLAASPSRLTERNLTGRCLYVSPLRNYYHFYGVLASSKRSVLTWPSRTNLKFSRAELR